MAQPPPPPPPRPPITGQRFLEFVLDREQHELATSLFQHLNLRDYMILRTRLNSQILDRVDPVHLFNQNRNPRFAPPAAPAVAPPAAPTAAATANTQLGAADYLRTNLGAHCNDRRYIHGAALPQQNQPCTNGPMSMVRMEPCKHANPTGIPPGHAAPHAPFPIGIFNVCDPCNQSHRFKARIEVRARIPARWAILCKSHSLSLRRRDLIYPVRGCSCARDINAGHKCSGCRLHTEVSTYAVGDARKDVLQRTHISYKEKGRKGRKSLVVRPDVPRNRRTRPACPEPGCGKKPWIRHPKHPQQGQREPDIWKHANAGLMCLCCNQGIL